MTLIDKIKRDREEGTPGRFIHLFGDTCVYTRDPKDGCRISPVFQLQRGNQWDLGRAAHIPDMEAALLVADELAEALEGYKVAESAAADTASPDDYEFVFEMWAKVEAALAAWNAATKGDQTDG